jgi:hypothetical protein
MDIAEPARELHASPMKIGAYGHGQAGGSNPAQYP